MILHPIAAGFTGVSVIMGILGLVFRNPIAAAFMTYLSVLVSSLVLIALSFDLGLWIHVRDEIRRQGIHAELGNAVWLTLTAYIVTVLSYWLGACSIVEISIDD